LSTAPCELLHTQFHVSFFCSAACCSQLHRLVLQPGQSLTGLYVGTPGNHRVNSQVRYALNNGGWEPLELGQFISLIEPSPAEYRFQLETLSTATTGSKRQF